MRSKKEIDRCAVCGGTVEKGKTTITVDHGEGVVVVRNVPAMVCTQCGEDWIEDHHAKRIEDIVDEAKSKHTEVEVMSLPM
jgi:YgiT-type zinc finger domain-containing protein